MGREIQFCLVYRDMWQSSGKYMPTTNQLVRAADPIILMGCFRRVETNGGGFEQINLLQGENPNQSVRQWTKPFHKAGIQTQMLERGLNGLRMSPCAADLRKLQFEVKKKQGTDISRSFDGLNTVQNLENSIKFAREAGMISQAALCITVSPIHTVDYFVRLADQYIELGAEEICVKDMAGVGRPASIGKIIKGIKDRHPDMLVQYHAHATPGFSVASSLEAARAGVDIIDVGMEPLSWGTGHADLLTIHAMLSDAGFSLPDINMEAYMAARSMSQEFMDDFLGYFINPQNRLTNSILIGSGLPGGMMGSLMADLEKNLKSLNSWLEKRGQEPMTQDQLLLKLFQEVEYVWPQIGYPPLVTPYSQYVKNVALMNVIQTIKGHGRWTMIDENTWSMILGKTGQLPGPVGEELVALAKVQGREFYNGNPQELYPDELGAFAEKMDNQGWDFGQDKEELFEYAMHPQQYEDYKSGKAKERFEAELQAKKEKKAVAKSTATPQPQVQGEMPPTRPSSFIVSVDGEKFQVDVEYPGDLSAPMVKKAESNPQSGSGSASESTNGIHKDYKHIQAPLEGTFYLTKESSETAVKVGDIVDAGDTVAYIESMKVINAITASEKGRIVEIRATHGQDVEEDTVLIKLAPV